ncbi:MAG: MFS transporter [Actinomycetota bacterium]|nr:MFS transporter [Actinomycetota bacterium]
MNKAAGLTVFAVVAAAVSFVISLAGSSLKSVVQVLFLPIAEGFDVSRGTLAVATTVFAVVTGISSAVIGHLADKIGAVPVLAIGAGVTGVVLVLCGSTNDIWVFILCYGVLGALGLTMLSFVPLGVLAAQLFQGRNTGVAYAVLTNGGAVGFMVLVPLWGHLNQTMTWNEILFAVGVVFLVVLLPASILLVRYSGKRTRQPAPDTTLLEGMRVTFADRRTTPLIIAFFGCGSTMAFVDVHLYPHMHDHGVPTSVGSTSIAVLGAVEIIGSLVAGRLCDLGRIRFTLAAAYALRAIATFLLVFVSGPSTALMITFGALFGASYLASVVATTSWLAKILPPGVRGTAIGVLWTIHMIAVALSSQTGAMIADATGSYLAMILICTALTLGSTAIIAFQPDPDAKPKPPVETREPVPSTEE